MDAASYQENKARRKGQARTYHKLRAEWHKNFKKGRPCADCGGVFHHAAMHWDHLPWHTKVDNVSRLVHIGAKVATILAEIAKCELVCANCHAVRTHNRANGM